MVQRWHQSCVSSQECRRWTSVCGEGGVLICQIMATLSFLPISRQPSFPAPPSFWRCTSHTACRGSSALSAHWCVRPLLPHHRRRLMPQLFPSIFPGPSSSNALVLKRWEGGSRRPRHVLKECNGSATKSFIFVAIFSISSSASSPPHSLAWTEATKGLTDCCSSSERLWKVMS